MARVYVSVGSNIDPADNIRSAVRSLRSHYPRLILSSVYESEAVGFDGDNFYNFVVGFDTDEDIHTVAAVLRRIEDDHARDRNGPRFSSRTVDLDLLLYDDYVSDDQSLNVPRDEIETSAFVLWPLAEIASGFMHPSLHRSMAELWEAFDRDSQVLWPIDFSWD